MGYIFWRKAKLKIKNLKQFTFRILRMTEKNLSGFCILWLCLSLLGNWILVEWTLSTSILCMFCHLIFIWVLSKRFSGYLSYQVRDPGLLSLTKSFVYFGCGWLESVCGCESRDTDTLCMWWWDLCHCLAGFNVSNPVQAGFISIYIQQMLGILLAKEIFYIWLDVRISYEKQF